MSTTELAAQYEPEGVEAAITERWNSAKAFAASPDERDKQYVVMMPLPNVTGALHMGHAMDNVMQDLLIRWHRMQGDNTLWMAGTDHAGIATQAVVEKRLKELENKTRHDIGREALVERIWEWKHVCQKRIVSQQQAMGCSCDWDRQRFTLDAVCARSVTYTFFSLFKDGLIFQGNRLVNWDCTLGTAVANDEVYAKTVNGHFWHIKYPVIDPKPGEPEFVVVATTRPETLLGDTAVACHPTPGRQLDKQIKEAEAVLAEANDKERPAAQDALDTLIARKDSHLAQLEQFAAMAADGRQVMLPLQNRPIPLITDIWAKPELGSGCVKITPAHDPNDYEVWGRHSDHIDIINILNPDGTINAEGGHYAGLDRKEARKKMVADLDEKGLLKKVEDRQIEVGHSDRSKTPIEPFLSLQWFVKMDDVDGGVTLGRGTSKEHSSPGLAQAAIDAVEDERVTFHPEERYGRTYVNWLSEKRDWCISRQLWWGHRIPIWSKNDDPAIIDALQQSLEGPETLHAIQRDEEDGSRTLLICIQDPAAETELVAQVEAAGLNRDPDVLDTWFSSALWPHSTLGWPDALTAQQEPGQPSLEGCLDQYYPGGCLVTGRDIITLWVARMVLAGLYNLGDIPFRDVFIHANIMDGKGERMSKSKGNGIDPLDIIARYGCDAMRYCICDMQTGLQDIRLPVQVESPFTGTLIDLHQAKHGRTIFTYLCPESGKEFDVLGTMEDIPSAQPFSTRFEDGKHFCNKLWNAARFAFQNLDGVAFRPLTLSELAAEDQWILSRLTRTVTGVQEQLEAYNPSAAIGLVRDFFWGELCDWYLEMLKPRLREGDADAKQVLAAALDQVLRMLHPFVPYITEQLWNHLNEIAPQRGIESALPTTDLLCLAAWPEPETAWINEALEAKFDTAQDVIKVLREIRNRYSLPPRQELHARIKVSGPTLELLEFFRGVVIQMAVLGELEMGPDLERTIDSATGVSGDTEIFVPGVVDLDKERSRLEQLIGKLTKGAEGTRKKLSNEKFVANAPAEVVDAERARLAEMDHQLEALNANLAALG